MNSGSEEHPRVKFVDSQAIRNMLRMFVLYDVPGHQFYRAIVPLNIAWFNLKEENPFPEGQTSNCYAVSQDQIQPGETLIFSIGSCDPSIPIVNFNLGEELTGGNRYKRYTSHLQALLRVQFDSSGNPKSFEILDLGGTNPTRIRGVGQQMAHNALAIRKTPYWRNIQWERVAASTLNPNGRYVDCGSRLWFGGATQWELVATPGVEIKAGHRNKPIAFILREILK
jgi:hypothetical protein